MDIKIWGPSLWELIHAVTYGYNNTLVTDIKKKQYINFFTSLGIIIPCKFCKVHYNEYLQKNPIKKAVKSYKELLIWTNNLHNKVNKYLNKKIYTLKESQNIHVDTKNNVKVNHKLIYKFINHVVMTINSVTFKSFKSFFNSLYHIYPCNYCRVKLNIFDRTNRLHLTSLSNIQKWYLKLNIHSLHINII